MSTVTTLLNNAFSQRQISTIYESLNQYRVVMEIDPSYAQYPRCWSRSTSSPAMAGGCRWRPSPITSAAWRKIGSATMGSSPPRTSTSTWPRRQPDQATLAIERAVAAIGLPSEVQGGSVAPAARVPDDPGQPLMILGALLLVYIVLGILYESYIHPLTILSTCPSAGVGALLAIILTGDQFSLISLLGLFLLIGWW